MSLIPLEQLFNSGQLFYLPATEPIGLILKFPHHADFAGCGSAVGGKFDLRCVSVYPIGNFNFCLPETCQQRQFALKRRMDYMYTIHRITSVQAPLQRAYLMVRQLSRWLNPEEAQKIPPELLASLIGVLPKTIEVGWLQYLHHSQTHFPSTSTPSTLPFSGEHPPAVVPTSFNSNPRTTQPASVG